MLSRLIIAILSLSLLFTSCDFTKKNVEEQDGVEDQTPKSQKELDIERVEEYLSKNNITASKTLSGLYYHIEEKGSGDAIGAESNVQLNAEAKLLSGDVFYSSDQDNQPLMTIIGEGMTIAGLEEGLQLLSLGAKATFYIPAYLAYGEEGRGSTIPPNVALIWKVEVISVQ